MMADKFDREWKQLKQLMEWKRDDPTDPEFHREGLQAEFMQGLQRWLQSVKDNDTVEGSDTYYFVEHLLDNVKDHNREGTLPWKEESE